MSDKYGQLVAQTQQLIRIVEKDLKTAEHPQLRSHPEILISLQNLIASLDVFRNSILNVRFQEDKPLELNQVTSSRKRKADTFQEEVSNIDNSENMDNMKTDEKEMTRADYKDALKSFIDNGSIWSWSIGGCASTDMEKNSTIIVNLDIKKEIKRLLPQEASEKRLLSLLPGKWLNDDAFEYLNSMAKNPRDMFSGGIAVLESYRFYALKTYDQNKLHEMYETQLKYRLNFIDHILIPVNVENLHWYLMEVHISRRIIRVMDSLYTKSKSSQYTDDVQVINRLLALMNPMFDPDLWNLQIYRKFPQQQNGSDCGVLTLMAITLIYVDGQHTLTSLLQPECTNLYRKWIALCFLANYGIGNDTLDPAPVPFGSSSMNQLGSPITAPSRKRKKKTIMEPSQTSTPDVNVEGKYNSDASSIKYEPVFLLQTYLKQLARLEIKNSNEIAGRNGLFTKFGIKKGGKICMFTGQIVINQQNLNVNNKSYIMKYSYKMDYNVFKTEYWVDATNEPLYRCPVKSIVFSKDITTSNFNAKFACEILHKNNEFPILFATRDINPGEELIAYYDNNLIVSYGY